MSTISSVILAIDIVILPINNFKLIITFILLRIFIIRYAFRSHFLQFAGFRCVRSVGQGSIVRMIDTKDFEQNITEIDGLFVMFSKLYKKFYTYKQNL